MGEGAALAVEEGSAVEEGGAAEGSQGDRTVSVLAVWGGDELDNFRAMIAPFEERTGITVEYEGTRDLNAVLTTRIEGGNPPDLAGLPGPGQLLQYAREGHLVPLNDVLDMPMMQEHPGRVRQRVAALPRVTAASERRLNMRRILCHYN